MTSLFNVVSHSQLEPWLSRRTTGHRARSFCQPSGSNGFVIRLMTIVLSINLDQPWNPVASMGKASRRPAPYHSELLAGLAKLPAAATWSNSHAVPVLQADLGTSAMPSP
jgi:hypothetical protein